MRSILEKAIVHLLNENEDKAAELFHKFTVERSRQIHESLRQGADPILEEGWDEMSEHYFTEEDLEGVEDHEEETADEADHDAEEHMEEPAEEGEESHDDMSDEDKEDHEEEHEEESHEEHMEIEDRLEKLEDDLAKMTAEFEKMNADEQAEDEDMDAQEEMADKIEDDMGDSVEECMDETMEESEDEEYSDISESIVNELEKISLTLADGKFLDGSSVDNEDKAAPMFGKKAETSDAKPSPTKQTSNDSFDREAAPQAKPAMKKSRARAKATDGMEKLNKEGDKAALLNKDFAGK